MSTIHVKTLIEAMNVTTALTLAELCEATGYPTGRVLQFIWEARANGHSIHAFMGASKGEPTTYEVRIR